MRQAWDTSEQAARDAVKAHGVAFNTVDTAAFRTAAEPLLRDYLATPELASLHRRIRDLA